MEIGEGFVGVGANAAHVNTVLGSRQGPIGTAWAMALASPSTGHTPFLVVAQPGVAVCPPTVFVNKAAVATPAHGNLTWGPAQAGIARGTALALAEGVVDRDQAASLCCIAAVWVDPAADDAEAVYANNTRAMLEALTAGHQGTPGVERFLEAAAAPFNPFFRPAPGNSPA